MSPRRLLAVVLGLIYLALTIGVLVGSDVDGADTLVFRWAATDPWPWLHWLLSWWVLLGQRAVCVAVAAIWCLDRLWRRRDLRSLLTFVVVTLVLNISIGVVKVAIGRLGPLQLGAAASHIGATRVFDDGTIFPSGHTANAVVIWGLMALLARRHRPLWAVVAGFLGCTVGLSTIYIGTHWLSDVVAGWAAGGLVLLAVPSMSPLVDRLERLVRGLAAFLRRPRPVGHRWEVNFVVGPLTEAQPIDEEARVLEPVRHEADAGTGRRRVRIGQYLEPPRAAASS